jgi:hypothetical protein
VIKAPRKRGEPEPLHRCGLAFGPPRGGGPYQRIGRQIRPASGDDKLTLIVPGAEDGYIPIGVVIRSWIERRPRTAAKYSNAGNGSQPRPPRKHPRARQQP